MPPRPHLNETLPGSLKLNESGRKGTEGGSEVKEGKQRGRYTI